MNIYRHNDYISVLKEMIKLSEARAGYKSKLAEAGGFQPSYLSHVLAGAAQLTPDHAIKIAEFWALPAKDKDYFLELVNLARASTKELRAYIKARLDRLKADAEAHQFKERAITLTGEAAQGRYYSSWIYGALHMGLTVPSLRTVTALATRFNLPPETVERVLGDLVAMNLAQRRGNHFEATVQVLASEHGSHHGNVNMALWASRAASEIGVQRSKHNLFRNSVYGLSEEDLVRARDLAVEFLKALDRLALPSVGEEVFCMNFHLFKV